jgi:hypothetical protein
MPNASYTTLGQHEYLSYLVSSEHLLCTANSGKTALEVYRDTPFAAMAEPPYCGPYVSTRYSAAEVYIWPASQRRRLRIEAMNTHK